MKRKQKRGIYTNKTIKSCPTCEYYCVNCKSVCKIETIGLNGCQYIAENHPEPSSLSKKIQLHHRGIGSLEPGKKFICYARKSHRHPKRSQKEINKKYSEKSCLEISYMLIRTDKHI